jgi:histidine ammonia-lyase
MLSLLVHDAGVVWRTSVGAAAMSLEALRGTPAPLDARIHENRPHPGQIEAAALMRHLLADSEIRESHRENDDRVQDAYSLRCSPQVFGATLDAIRFVEGVARIELNASTDNPLVFERARWCREGTFTANRWHRRSTSWRSPSPHCRRSPSVGWSGWSIRTCPRACPRFLTSNPGLSSGYMMVQITAASLVAESRSIAMPASIGSIPTDANQEDFVPMGMAAAFKGIPHPPERRRGDRGPSSCVALRDSSSSSRCRPGRGVGDLYARIRSAEGGIPPLGPDRPPAPDLECLAARVLAGELAPSYLP